MSVTYYLVDDDRTVRKMLERIITDHDLGAVTGGTDNGMVALQEIAAAPADIVLVDLLLPGIDGITLVGQLKAECPRTGFVMLSQVADKDMVAKAYQAGVDFFINKPLNVIEVVSVIKQVRERVSMKNFIQSLRVTIDGIDTSPPARADGRSDDATHRKQIRSMLVKLGILGERGSEDITRICMEELKRASKAGSTRKMGELYRLVAEKYADKGARINAASVEQRVRRAVYKALNNTANLGLEDYANEFFVEFGSSFFDFTEIRTQMNYLRGNSPVQGKINVKKFIEGLVMQVQDR